MWLSCVQREWKPPESWHFYEMLKHKKRQTRKSIFCYIYKNKKKITFSLPRVMNSEIFSHLSFFFVFHELKRYIQDSLLQLLWPRIKGNLGLTWNRNWSFSVVCTFFPRSTSGEASIREKEKGKGGNKYHQVERIEMLLNRVSTRGFFFEWFLCFKSSN